MCAVVLDDLCWYPSACHVYRHVIYVPGGRWSGERAVAGCFSRAGGESTDDAAVVVGLCL